VRPDGVGVLPPLLDEHLGLEQRVERVPMLPKHTTCPAFAQPITAKSVSDILDRSPPR
jgi:hypothetical protein